MSWTSDKPTEPGWYWVKTNAINPQIVQLTVYVNGSNTVSPALVAVNYNLTGGELWSGPLVSPT